MEYDSHRCCSLARQFAPWNFSRRRCLANGSDGARSYNTGEGARKILRHASGILALCCCVIAVAQEAVFRSKVDLVLVPVVVRDGKGRPIANLTKDDFELFDQGRKQTIASFSAVRRSVDPGKTKDSTKAAASEAAPDLKTSSTESARPQRHLIYLFDDLNLRFTDMARVRESAMRNFQSTVDEGDRVAIYTFSRNPTLEFTADRDKLETAVSQLRWQPMEGHGGMGCPDVSYYIATLVIDNADSQVIDALTNYTAQCAHVRPEIARAIAISAANQEMIIGAHHTQIGLRALRQAVERLSTLPGQRLIVLVSPGFFAQTPAAAKSIADILNLAARSEVTISGLSVRGVIVGEEEEDVTRKGGSGRRSPPSQFSPDQSWIRYRRDSARADTDVLGQFAAGTGGVFFHNNNDIGVGLKRLASAPEFSYVLGFSPDAPNADGTVHSLRVKLPGRKGVSVEARRGYVVIDADSKFREMDLDEAIYSRDEKADISVVLQAGYSLRKDDGAARVLLAARIDPGPRDLTVAAALFDREGNYVSGVAERMKPGDGPEITAHLEIADVKSGAYRVRFVVREPESHEMTLINRALTIP